MQSDIHYACANDAPHDPYNSHFWAASPDMTNRRSSIYTAKDIKKEQRQVELGNIGIVEKVQETIPEMSQKHMK